jgi:hypothetical protein
LVAAASPAATDLALTLFDDTGARLSDGSSSAPASGSFTGSTTTATQRQVDASLLGAFDWDMEDLLVDDDDAEEPLALLATEV